MATRWYLTRKFLTGCWTTSGLSGLLMIGCWRVSYCCGSFDDVFKISWVHCPLVLACYDISHCAAEFTTLSLSEYMMCCSFMFSTLYSALYCNVSFWKSKSEGNEWICIELHHATCTSYMLPLPYVTADLLQLALSQTLQDHRYRLVPAFSGTHRTYPWRDSQAE